MDNGRMIEKLHNDIATTKVDRTESDKFQEIKDIFPISSLEDFDTVENALATDDVRLDLVSKIIDLRWSFRCLK